MYPPKPGSSSTVILLLSFLVQPTATAPTPAPAVQPTTAAPKAEPPAKEEMTFEPKAPALAKAAEAKDAKAVEALLLTIAGEYTKYARVSDRAMWAPERCSAPPSVGVVTSASTQEATHGRKLYFLYAADEDAYEDVGMKNRGQDDYGRKAPARPDGWANPVGMIVVKEAFKPVEVKAGEKVPEVSAEDRERGFLIPPTYTTRDGKTFKAGDPAGLFIMVKLDPKQAGTDEGWVYATTSPDGKKITGSGSIESCIDCHKETGRDRLYGPPWSWPMGADFKPVAPGKAREPEKKEKAGS